MGKLIALIIACIVLIIWGCLEITNNNYHQRRQDCSIINHRKATEYEYYDCMGKG